MGVVGFRVQGSGFRGVRFELLKSYLMALGVFRVQGFGVFSCLCFVLFRVWGFRVRVWGLGFGVQGFGLMCCLFVWG